MARIRSIKPEFWTSMTIAALSPIGALTFIGLWNHCDDYGRAVDEPRLIKAAVHPLRDHVTVDEVAGILDELARLGLIVRYEVAGRRYLAVSSWTEHQKPDKKKPSKLPAPPGCRDDAEAPAMASASDQGGVVDRSGNDQAPEQGAGSREMEQGDGSGSREQQREERLRERCVRLTAAANRGISERFGEQPMPIRATHPSVYDTVEALTAAGVPDDFAVRHVYERARTLTTDRPPRSLGYFRAGTIEAWEAEVAHRQAATAQIPVVDGKVVGKIDPFTRMAITQAKRGDPEWIAECERQGIDYAAAEVA